MRKKNALLIIDAQYDFCNPKGALFVPNADEDMKRLSEFILKNKNEIDHICVTIDSHPVNDISHPSFWKDAQGNFPPPFSQITLSEIQTGKWTPRFEVQKATEYVKNLEAQGQFPHFIWPEHCLIASQGNSLDQQIFNSLHTWATDTGKQYQTAIKGTNPLTEHFGIFMAQIPISDAPETQLNTTLLAQLNEYTCIYVAGEAKSHCVATSIKQAMDFAPDLARKMVILEDCMSDVTGLGYLGEPIYKEAKEKGIRFANSEKETL
jgi:nicotinamidase/pyrazinamidase